MKKSIVIYCFFLFILTKIYSQEDYGSGNGKIINIINRGSMSIVERKHIQNVQIGNLAGDQSIRVYNKPNLINSSEIYKLVQGEKILVNELYKYENSEEKIIEIWLKINYNNNKDGYLYFGKSDPYKNRNWSIIETITSSKKTWTVRNYEEYYFVRYVIFTPDKKTSVVKVLNVRDKPSVEDSTILFQLVPSEIGVKSIAVTEELEKINGITDHWVKIMDKENRIGWVFGGYLTTIRGGPKYLSPNHIIDFTLGDY